MIFMLLTKANKEDIVVLDKISCIYYPIEFKKNKIQVQAVINSSSDVIDMTLGYASELGLKIRPINVRVQRLMILLLKYFKWF